MRGSRVITYITGDRSPVPAQIGDDAVRPMYDHLRELGHVAKLDLFIYSRGGAIDVPWRIVTALRRTSTEWNVLVPFRANSAATLLALGADEIIFGRQGELGPIDPILMLPRVVTQPGGQQTMVLQEPISVEDIMSYVRFVQERAGLSDQAALASSLSLLATRLDALALGNAYRTHSHIRDVARRVLLSRKEPPREQAMGTIIETLAERVYAHGHAIDLHGAQEIGLPAHAAEAELDAAMWALLNQYEEDMKLLEPVDPMGVVATADLYTEDVAVAMIESAWAVHEHAGRLEVRAKRQMPPNVNVSLNLNLQLPPNVLAAQPALAALMQQLQQAIIQEAQRAALEAIRSQAPLIGGEIGLRNARWRRSA